MNFWYNRIVLLYVVGSQKTNYPVSDNESGKLKCKEKDNEMFEKLYFCGVLSLCLAVCVQTVQPAIEEQQGAVEHYSSYSKPTSYELTQTVEDEESHQSLFVDYGFLND